MFPAQYGLDLQIQSGSLHLQMGTVTEEVDTVTAGPDVVKHSLTRLHAACPRMQHGQLVRVSLGP